MDGGEPAGASRMIADPTTADVGPPEREGWIEGLFTRSGKRWWAPLVWIGLTPIVTVPLTLQLTSVVFGTGACTYVDHSGWFVPAGDIDCASWAVMLALTPGLLNLVALFSLRSKTRRVRIAGAVASGLAVARLLVPLIGVLTASGQAGRLTLSLGRSHFSYDYFAMTPPYPGEGSPIGGGLLLASFCLWICTWIALVRFRVAFRRDGAVESVGRG